VHHDASADVSLRFDKKLARCGAQSMAEVYSTLTRMPGKHRISGEQAMLFLSTIAERLTIVSLDDSEYFMAIEAASPTDVVGGAIFDAILARCAIKARAEAIYTWNVKHYRMFGLEVAKRVRTP
jgi:predicted nucleic acid-binding protein